MFAATYFRIFCLSISYLRKNVIIKILWCVEPFLGNDRKQTGSSGNTPLATMEVLLETVFYTLVRAEELLSGMK
jgi:hypothetical protein